MPNIGVLLTVFGVALTLIIGSPFLAKIGLYYIFRPNIDISFGTRNCPLHWTELVDASFNFFNHTEYRYVIEYEVRVDKEWGYTSPEANKEYYTTWNNGMMAHRKSEFAGREIVLTDMSGKAMAFPLEPERESAEIEIVLFPHVELSEFGFPEFFPRVQLKPIKKNCDVVVSADEISEEPLSLKRVSEIHQKIIAGVANGKMRNVENK